MMKTEQQLPLQLSLRDDATFENFLCGKNTIVLEALHALLANRGEHFIYCWGALGVGRSHLLQACCHALASTSNQVVYLSLQNMPSLSPSVLENLEQLSLICIDDIDVVLGNTQWEEALFHFYNRVRDANSRLVVSASCAPRESNCQLMDLRSRLAWGLVFKIESLTDEEKIQALQMRAENRGLVLPKEVGQYLLRRFPRNMVNLFDVLEKLDQASLIAKRLLTIPFVKTVLSHFD